MVSFQNITNISSLSEQREVFHSTSPYALDCYPEINLNCDVHVLPSSGSFQTLHNALVPVNEGVVKRITRTFFESGFHEALKTAREPSSTPFVSSLAEYTWKTVEFIEKLKAFVYPHAKDMQSVNSIATYSETRDWARSYIRCIVWHPNCFKIAVAASDDTVRIYTDEPAVVPLLKSGSQRCITSMAWRPYCASELAVGCQKGICLWTMDNNMHITRTSSQALFLEHPNGCTITSLQWNIDGTLLAAASIGDTDVLIWNVDKMQSTALTRVGPPCSILKWSPDGSHLFSATVGNVFRVWSVDKNWVSERWTISAGHIQSACWSPCGSFLLFVTSEDPTLYRLQFFEEQLFISGSIPKQALPIADLSKVIVGQREIGGLAQSVAWDQNGRYLAIMFKDTSCITIFSTSVQKFNLTISPSSFITGIGVEHPSYMCFQSKNRKNSDPVLTIGWSSGRIQYFPFVDI